METHHHEHPIPFGYLYSFHNKIYEQMKFNSQRQPYHIFVMFGTIHKLATIDLPEKKIVHRCDEHFFMMRLCRFVS